MLKNAIPFIDLRGKTSLDLLRAYPDKGRHLVKCARRAWGLPSYLASAAALPLTDRLSHAWLKRSRNPYLYEIESCAEILGVPGGFTLNLSYEWGCTSGVWRTGSDSVSLLHVLDWPFPELGRQAVVTLQQAPAGEFYNIAWPGMAGVIMAMAPGRFSASINQAPMRRHGRGFAGDWFTNRLLAGGQSGLPPPHLLRQVFEKTANYDEAKAMLIRTPLAVPAIFVLAGVEPGQGCIIERLENTAQVAELSAGQQMTTTNHFNSQFASFGRGWRPREPDSAGRYRQSSHISEADLEQPHFNWLQAPILNINTRLCLLTDAQSRRLMVQGFEGIAQATDIFHLPAVAYESREAV